MIRTELQNDSLQLKMLQALDSSMDGIALLDANGAYYYLNPMHVTMFDYEREEELLGKTWHYIYEPEEIERIDKQIFPLLVQKGKWTGVTTGKGKTGRIIYQEISLSFTQDGGIICICRDIEERIKAQRKQQLNTEILNQTNSIAIVTNKEREIEWVNAAFTRVSGYTLDEVLGKNPGKLLQGKDSDPATIAYLRDSIRALKPFSTELVNYNKDGTPYWIEIKGQPLLNERGDVEHFFAIEEDITPRKKAEQLLAESKFRLEMAIDAANAAMWEWDMKTGIVNYSRSWMELIGYQDEEITPVLTELTSRIHPDDFEKVQQAIQDCLDGKTALYETEYRIRHKNGHYLSMLDRAKITERDPAGTPQRLIGIATNITVLKEIQHNLAESEQRYRRSLEASGAAIWEWNIERDELTATQEFYKLLGLDERSTLPLSYSTLIPLVHPDDVPVMDKGVQDHFKGLTTLMDIEYRHFRQDKKIYEWYNLKGAVIDWTPDRKPIRGMGFTSSIQKRKDAERELKERNEMLKVFVDAAGVALWEWDIVHDRVLAGKDFAALFGYDSFEELPQNISQQIATLIHPQDIPSLQEAIRHHFQGLSSLMDLEFRIRAKNSDAYTWFNIKGRVIGRDLKGGPQRAAGIIHNIQERKEAELVLGRAKELAEASVKAKRRFLANISHEIRTPMHAIMGIGQELLATDTDPIHRTKLQMINESGKALLGIINDVLDFSKIEEGKMLIESVRFQFQDLLYGIYDLFSGQAGKKALKYDLHVDPVLNGLFFGDPVRIRQIFVNIISNAIKFTEHGFVRISCQLAESPTNGPGLLFVCEDSGIGMSEEMQGRIFEDFHQEDESFQRRYGGSGLGLSITRELLKMMGGTIRVNSRKGAGTRVEITLPLQPVAGHPGTESGAPGEVISYDHLKRLRILSAEDNEINRMLLQFMLQRHGIPCDFSVNGKEAVEQVRSKPYDIILMDIQMPEMDGIQATRYIRTELKSKVPIIALTANAVKEEIEGYLSEGLNDYLVKPFDEKALLQKLSAFAP
jgi:PAS domain S-box-containing protein